MDRATILQRAKEYISAEHDPVFRAQVENLVAEENWDELNDRFFTDLSFGTGGLRGVIGGGSNRMNSLTVQKATQGLANYIAKAAPGAGRSVVIAFDSRAFSDTFAIEAARVLGANGITAYVFTGLRPTPELSFAVRHLHAAAGIVVTASHNPPQYNGYKVYWQDGAQVISPHDEGIIAEARSVKQIALISRQEALDKGLLVMIDKEVDEPFIDMIKRQALRPRLLREHGRELKVVYTPLHGAGAMPVERALAGLGVDVIFVEEQRLPDGRFPTVKFPNPEEASAMKMAMELAAKEEADLAMGTDPDADRFGIAVRHDGRYRLITGNQLGTLLLDYIASSRTELGTLPRNGAFVKTIVTTGLQRLIAEDYGLRCYDTLTGFKYIGEKIRQFESTPNGPVYVFGGEESYGYLVETEVRDKDGVSAATMTVEMTLYHRVHGKTLVDRLNELYEKYGYFEEILISKGFKGETGLRAMDDLMRRLRASPPAVFAGGNVAAIKDYQDGTTLDMTTKSRVRDIDLPSSNVLQFILSDGTIVSARPSGTEPKIKFYASCRSRPGMMIADARSAVEGKLRAIREQLDSLIGA